MLTAELIYTHQSSDIADYLPIYESQKLLVVKKNGDVEVFSRSADTIKLYQTYPGLLKAKDNTGSCKELIYAHAIGTIFVRSDKSLQLLNSSNLHEYDKISERRGISRCWIVDDRTKSLDTNESELSKSDSTILVYTTHTPRVLRLFEWRKRSFQNVYEVPLNLDKTEIICDVSTIKDDLVVTTNKATYLWNYKTAKPVMNKITKMVKKRTPDNIITALTELERQSLHFDEASDYSIDMQSSIFSGTSFSEKKSRSNIWSKFKGIQRANLQNEYLDKVLYSAGKSDGITIMDMKNHSIVQLKTSESNEPFLLINKTSENFRWHNGVRDVHYLSSIDSLIQIYDTYLLITDCEYGVPFLQIDVQEGIKDFKQINGQFLLIHTRNDCFKSIKLKLRDLEDDSNSDEMSLTTSVKDHSSFEKLWKEVLIYTKLVESTSLPQFCNNNDEDEQTRLLVSRLRDVTVLFNLQLLDKFFSIFNRINNNNNLTYMDPHLPEIIISEIFGSLSNFWAPPQLVISRSLPKSIAKLVGALTGEYHDFSTLSKGDDTGIQYELIAPNLISYLIDVRRYIRRLVSQPNELLQYTSFTQTLLVDINFFLIDDHEDTSAKSLLSLIDTVLFKVYLNYKPALLAPFLRIPNDCNYEIVVNDLKIAGLTQELVDFYFQRGKHEFALNLITELIDDSTKSDGYQAKEQAITVLVIQYLQKLSNDDLEVVFSYTDWLLRKFPKSKVQIITPIFMTETMNSRSYEYQRVYNFIKRSDSTLSLQYLEYIIGVYDARQEFIEVELISRYIENLPNQDAKSKLASLIKLIKDDYPAKCLETLQERLPGLPQSDKKFVMFLQTFFLFHLNRHVDSLNILFDQLHDLQKTISYCNSVYEVNDQIGSECFLTLFEKILQSGDYSEMHLQSFLEDNFLKMDPLQLLQKIPTSIPLTKLTFLLSQIMKMSTFHVEDSFIEKDLVKTNIIKTTSILNEEKSKYTTVSEAMLCSLCKRKLVNNSNEKLTWYKDREHDKLMHLSCRRIFLEKQRTDKTKNAMKTLADLT
ncbi:Vacuolar sorting protein 39 domain 1 [Nakaseomyces glabratus]|nr:Vacuolar sorting protein 39 domain 1 [Nakaseomyces glabratus]KAH7596521.1 Vacuolar sorting protein 39 domain 1 [Nakaseomyces glabratus]